ncbi:hypothetical protein DMB41_11940 [Pectobacterium carotovorum subsp. carotovorum]|nr:hypothetical protein DMB41_11940 [Pectobacterium carotovorum subsp. carotovorum]
MVFMTIRLPREGTTLLTLLPVLFSQLGCWLFFCLSSSPSSRSDFSNRAVSFLRYLIYRRPLHFPYQKRGRK